MNFTPVSENYPASAPTQVVAQQGDTLRVVAARVWGDSSLWYLIGEENGLTDPAELIEPGTVLRIPNDVVSMSNAAGIFKPFSVQQAIGDTTLPLPSPPMPNAGKKGCGTLGMIIVIAVAVIVTYFTAGAAAPAAQGFVATFASAGPGVLAGAAAAGSVASQIVGVAIGVQEEFSWKSVAFAALSAGVTAGIGRAEWFSALKAPAQAAAQAAAGSAITQGAAVLTRLKDEFSWREVAISAAAAPATRAVRAKLGDTIAGDVSSSLTGAGVRLALGGKVDSVSVLADAFGNAFGNSVVNKMAAYEARLDAMRKMEEYVLVEDPLATVRQAQLERNPDAVDLAAPAAPDEHRAVRAVQELASRVASTRPESTLPVMDEVIVTGRRVSPAQQQAFETREALAQLLQNALAEHRAEQTLRNQVAAEMGYLETAWVGFGAMGYNAYQGAKAGLQGLGRGAASLYEFNQRLVGAALHLDFDEYFAEWGRAFDALGDQAATAASGVKNLATVLGDDESRQMLADFVAEYYHSSSTVDRTALLGALPAELLIAAGTAGAGTVVKGAGMTQRIGSAIGDLASALRRIEIEFVDIDATGPFALQRGSIGIGLEVASSRFIVAKHGDMPSPRPGEHSHHGVMSAWMEKHYPAYDPDQAPAVLMPQANHEATYGVYNTWRADMRKEMGGTFDWANVPESDMRGLSESMFDAAQVPRSVRQEYWDSYDRMKGALERE